MKLQILYIVSAVFIWKYQESTMIAAVKEEIECCLCF